MQQFGPTTFFKQDNFGVCQVSQSIGIMSKILENLIGGIELRC
jgi:hypothetical protein